MATKMTRQMAEERVKKILERKQEIVDSGCVEPVKYITSQQYIDKGVQVNEHYCQNCGTSFKGGTPARYYHKSTIQCPTCGNNRYTYSKSFTNNTMALVVFEQEDGFEFAVVRIKYQFPEFDENWCYKSPSTDIVIDYVGMFVKDYGWCVYSNNDGKAYKRESQSEINVLNKVRAMTPCNVVAGNWQDMLDEAETFEKTRKAKNAAKRTTSKSKLLDDMRTTYKPKTVDEDKLKDKVNTILYDVYSSKNGVTTYMTCCTKCGTMREVESVQNLSCPHCGTVGVGNTYYHGTIKSVQKDIAVFENTNLPENDLLVRLFSVKTQYEPTIGITKVVWEKQRIFLGKKVVVFSNGSRYASAKPVEDNFQKETIRDISSSLVGWNPDGEIVQDGEEIKNVIKNSCLTYSGLVENYGFGDSRYTGGEKAPSLKYILAWYKKPAIELILKANLTSMLDKMIKDTDCVGEGTTLADALMVKPAVAKMAVKLNCEYHQLSEISALYNADPNLTTEQYLQISHMEAGIQNVVHLKNNFNIDYTQTMKYLQAVYDHQCIPKREALNLWVDYLRMAQALKIDLTDKSRLYPGSLKKEHDVASFAYKAIQIEIDKEQFAAQAKKNIYYEYSYKDLIVVVPKTPQDIVEEATRQKNCLRSYVERVKNGDTVVVFIRRKIMPDATYVTAEVHDGELTQLKGYCNSNPRNKELVEFVQHWAKAKGIRVVC